MDGPVCCVLPTMDGPVCCVLPWTDQSVVPYRTDNWMRYVCDREDDKAEALSPSWIAFSVDLRCSLSSDKEHLVFKLFSATHLYNHHMCDD